MVFRKMSPFFGKNKNSVRRIEIINDKFLKIIIFNFSFKDVIDYEHLIVYTFDDIQYVSTFRTVQLPRDIDLFEKELVRQYTLNLLEKQKTKESQETQGCFFYFIIKSFLFN
jgi:hypothetical protein